MKTRSEYWKRITLTGNDGKRLDGWHKEDLLIARDINRGDEGWMFGLYELKGRNLERYLGEASSLREAKQMAKEELSDA